MHILSVHGLDEKPYALYHDDGVRRLYGYDNIVKALAAADTKELHA